MVESSHILTALDQEAGADKRDVAAAQDTVSHSAVKVGGYTASATGAVTEDDPRRSEGSWNSTIGAGKEAVGGLVGSESLRQQGIEQNQAGKAQEAQGQVSDFSGGVADRVKGAAGSTAAQFMGNREDQQYYQEMHDKGKTQQRGAEYDIQRQNPQ